VTKTDKLRKLYIATLPSMPNEVLLILLNKLLIHKAYMCKRKCQWHISN